MPSDAKRYTEIPRLGLLLAPCLPEVFFTDVCFFDAASIYHADAPLKQRSFEALGGFISISKELRALWTPDFASSFADHLLAVAAGPGTFRPSECQVTKCFADVLSFRFVTRAWAVSAKIRNALVHALNGNGGGSRTSARKRKQKQDSTQGNVNMQQVGEILKLITQLIQLLGLGGGGGGSGGTGNMLKQLVSLFGQGSSSDSNTTRPKKKKKKKDTNTQGGGLDGGGGGRGDSVNPHAPSDKQIPHNKQSQANTQQSNGRVEQPKHKPKTFAETVAANTTSTPFVPVWSLRESDWTAPVLNFDSFVTALDKPGNVSAAVHVETEDQLSELSLIVEGDSPAQPRELNVTAILLSSKGSERIAGRELRVVPGKKAGKVQPRQAYVIPISGQGPTLKRATVVSNTPAVAPDTVVVRLSVEAKYLQDKEWQSIKSKPRNWAQYWLSNHVPSEVAKKVFDLWGFQEETTKGGGKPIITGLLRIEKGAAKKIIGCSGKSQWFVEPLRWDDSVVESCSVEWIKKPNGFDGPAYFRHVQSLAGDLGIARGWNSLGVRKPRTTEPTVAKPRTWRVTGAPREWGSNTIAEELTRAGLQDVKILSRKTLGKQVEWWVEANAHKELDFLEIICGSNVIVAVAAPRQRPKRENTTSLASAGRVNFKFDEADFPSPPSSVPAFKSYYMGTPLKAKPAQGSKAEDEADVGKNDEAKKEEAEAGDKRPAISSPVKDRPAKKQTLETKPPHGLVARANPGGGNCVFEAIGQGVDKPARAVRASIVGHIKRHEGRYKPWWDGKEPSQEENECESWQKYLSSISKQGAWGGSLEIAAAAAHFDRSIVVFQPTGVPEIYNRHGKAGKTLALWFRAKHYELLEGELPKQIAEQAANGPMQGGRGGSDSNVSSQGRTRLSALPSLKSTASHKRARSMSPLPSSSFSERRRKLSPAAASSGRGVNAPTAAASSTDGKTATSSSARTEWKCPLCDFSTGPCRLWGQRKRAHIAAWHPEETESLSLRTLPALQPNSSKVQMRWKCPICNLGIPADLQINKDQYLRMRRKHHDEAHPEADLKLFKLDDSFRKVNVAKATQQVRAASFARRLLGIKKGDAGKHDPLLVSLPACNRTKNNNRTSFSKVICRKCGTIADRAKQLAKLRCEKFGSRGPKRKALIKRLRACLDKPSVSDNLKEGARTVLDIIDPGVPDTHSTQTHVVEALVWPTDFSVKFACVQCKRCVTRENRLRGPCNNQITWNQLRKGYKETLSKFACQQPGVRQRAAVRALQVLALENNEEGEQCP